ncbi:hypothetical protein [Bartonella jaculi]|uniref:Uncharacterized protein n=1 Tax=Bartonella jaculi TaxID=686226 RepID=A0ABP9NBF3_9HYPH
MKQRSIEKTDEEEEREELYDVYDDGEVLTMESATAFLKSLGWSVEIEGYGDHSAISLS